MNEADRNQVLHTISTPGWRTITDLMEESALDLLRQAAKGIDPQARISLLDQATGARSFLDALNQKLSTVRPEALLITADQFVEVSMQ